MGGSVCWGGDSLECVVCVVCSVCVCVCVIQHFRTNWWLLLRMLEAKSKMKIVSKSAAEAGNNMAKRVSIKFERFC